MISSLSGPVPALRVENKTRGRFFSTRHELSGRQLEVLIAGGLVNSARRTLKRSGIEAGRGAV